MNLYQSLADIPFVILQQRVRFSEVALALWGIFSLAFLLLIFALDVQKTMYVSAPKQTSLENYNTISWQYAKALFWWNPFYWSMHKNYKKVMALSLAPKESRSKTRRPRIFLLSGCAALIFLSYSTVLLPAFEPGEIEYVSYESMVGQTFIEPLPYGGYAYHERGSSRSITEEQKEQIEEYGVPVVWVK